MPITPSEHVLVTLSGHQTPPALSNVLEILGDHPLSDLGQLVVRDRFIATALLSSPRARDTVRDALFRAHERGIAIEFAVTQQYPRHESYGSLIPLGEDEEKWVEYVVTLFAEGRVPLNFLARVLKILCEVGGRVGGVERLTGEGQQFMCLEIRVGFGGGGVEQVRKKLFELGREVNQCDVALQKADVMRKAKRLVVFDLSWTLVQCDAMEVLLSAGGVSGGDATLAEKVEFLRGLQVTEVERKVGELLKFTNGAVELCKGLRRLGCKLAVVSSGAKMVADKVKEVLALDYAFGNVLEADVSGKFTGKLVTPIVDAERKAELVQMLAMQERIQMEQVIVVGDGPVSAKMLAVAGMSVAFDQPVSTDEVRGGRIASKSLMGVLYLLGVGGVDLRDVTRL